MITTNAHIGNYGTKNDEIESNSMKISGLICKNFNINFSRTSADLDINSYFINQNKVVIADVDTRALVRHIRDKGAMNGIISSSDNDVKKLREIFGELLKEVQRIKSEGDYKSCSDLVEKYGVKIDPITHKEVISRSNKLDIAPYSGFINPELKPTFNNKNEITNIEVIYPENFKDQMLKYAEKFSFLPNYN